jgi:ABC-type nitrate/sulfonate/bicarbonate transport system ATPase subunit
MISLKEVTKSYQSPGGDLSVFRNLSLNVKDREILGILGPSGCGKTTLLHLLSGMESPSSGEIHGIPQSSVTGRLSISYLFQEPRLLPWMSVEQNIDLVLRNHYPDSRERSERIRRFIDLVGLSGFAEFRPAELSGGMRQRAAVARAFAYPSQLILMDEPFQSLDADLKYQLISSYRDIWLTEPRTTVLVTHDIQEALLLADRIIVFSQRPARIEESFDVDIPRDLRSAANRDLMELAVRYFEKISSRG